MDLLKSALVSHAANALQLCNLCNNASLFAFSCAVERNISEVLFDLHGVLKTADSNYAGPTAMIKGTTRIRTELGFSDFEF